MTSLYWLTGDDDSPFPPLEWALQDPNGLLAAGGKLTTKRLVMAYQQGIFPWYNPGQPVLWWSPDPRSVLFPDRLKISRSLGQTLRRGQLQVTLDEAFPQVVAACAAPRNGVAGTWITPAVITAYNQLHEQGLAHSVETWQGETLVGGLYGVALGQVFFGESMFSLATDASKVALVHLVRQLQRWEFGLIDCQVHSPHLASLGAETIPRSRFVEQISDLANLPSPPTPWRLANNYF